VEQEMGNAAAQEQMKVEGAIGRVFNRIIGESETKTDTFDRSFTKTEVKDYLENQLKLAEGEWFRGSKLNGVTEHIIDLLDTNQDGEVTWTEFQLMRDTMRANLVGDLGEGASTEDVQAKADEIFQSVNDGEAVEYTSMKNAASEQLPEDADHKDLISQLAALLILDIVDLDERDKDVRDRGISRNEWATSVEDLDAPA